MSPPGGDDQTTAGAPDPPYCPSAQPDMAGSVVFGVVGGTVEQPRVAYLAEPLPVTPELLALADPVEPAEVFRFGAPCAESACRHFDGTRCRLVEALVAEVEPVVAALPPCRLRAQCRWWREEGPEACRRCPLIVTSSWNPGPELAHAAQRDLGNGDQERGVP
jgi:hypothetical protein